MRFYTQSPLEHILLSLCCGKGHGGAFPNGDRQSSMATRLWRGVLHQLVNRLCLNGEGVGETSLHLGCDEALRHLPKLRSPGRSAGQELGQHSYTEARWDISVSVMIATPAVVFIFADLRLFNLTVAREWCMSSVAMGVQIHFALLKTALPIWSFLTRLSTAVSAVNFTAELGRSRGQVDTMCSPSGRFSTLTPP